MPSKLNVKCQFLNSGMQKWEKRFVSILVLNYFCFNVPRWIKEKYLSFSLFCISCVCFHTRSTLVPLFLNCSVWNHLWWYQNINPFTLQLYLSFLKYTFLSITFSWFSKFPTYSMIAEMIASCSLLMYVKPMIIMSMSNMKIPSCNDFVNKVYKHHMH